MDKVAERAADLDAELAALRRELDFGLITAEEFFEDSRAAVRDAATDLIRLNASQEIVTGVLDRLQDFSLGESFERWADYFEADTERLVQRFQGGLPDGSRRAAEATGTTLYQRVLQRGMARFAAIDRALLAAADEPAPPTLNERVRAAARARFTAIDRALLSDPPPPPPPSLPERVRAAARARFTAIDRALLSDPPPPPPAALSERVRAAARARFTAIDRALLSDPPPPPPPSLGERARANARARFAAIDRALLSDPPPPPPPTLGERVRANARARFAEIDRALLAEVMAAPSLSQQAFNLAAGSLSLQLGRRRERENQPDSGGLADARRVLQAQEDAANQFASTVVAAGFGFAEAVIQAIKDGDIAGIIRAGLSGVGSVFGSANLGTIPFLGGSIGIGTLIAGGLGVLGTLVGALFSGGGQSDADRAAAESRRVGNVPAINLTFQVTQTNNYQGGPTQPENEQAFRRQANVLFEELYRRHLGPRLDRIEQRLGIAGAPA